MKLFRNEILRNATHSIHILNFISNIKYISQIIQINVNYKLINNKKIICNNSIIIIIIILLNKKKL